LAFDGRRKVASIPLVELGKGHLEAASAVAGVELGVAGARAIGSGARNVNWSALHRDERGGVQIPGTKRTPDIEYAEFLEFLRAEGATGPSRAGEGITMQPHGGATVARNMLGVSGQTYQSTHLLPKSVGRGVPGYNPSVALTRLEEKLVHGRMDQPWKDAFQDMRRNGATEASAQQVYDAVAESIAHSPDLSVGLKETLQLRLHDEMFVEYALEPTDMIPLPYPNIGPRP
jgi:hypothetical protein